MKKKRGSSARGARAGKSEKGMKRGRLTIPIFWNCPIGNYPLCVGSVGPRSVTNQENLSRFVWTQRFSGGCVRPQKKKVCPINRS